MYPTFSRRVHDVLNVIESSTKAQQILAERMGEPPDDWTRYVSIDPGFTVLAIEFLAVPPPELGNQIFVYDECYIRDPPVPTEAFGDAIQMKCASAVIEAFIFDMHGGRLRSIASGDIPYQKYGEALTARGIKPASGGIFRHGCDDIVRREEDMRTMLAIQRNGQPRLMVCIGKCPSLTAEIEKFKKKTVKQWGKEIAIDKGDRRVNTHAIDAIEQAIGLDLPYVKPRIVHTESSIVDRWNALRDRLKEKRRVAGIVLGGSSISLGPVGVST
jgi:hypothetical protein